ncbi:MAG: toll/interleukin-1 receptor domain-containing protein [Sphingomonadaceae bacterium]|nr:toll/interleukin-1 receptor domain-containing protein [Sphingomonadaceae bacterium]
MSHDVFISYCSEDGAVADAACAALERRGLRCWLAPRDLPRGQDYAEAIAAAIAAGRVLLLIHSAGTGDSVQAKREVERAAGLGLPIFALRIAEAEPAPAIRFLIGEGQWLDAVTPPVAVHLDHLGDRIAGLLNRTGFRPLQPTLPPRPLPDMGRRRHAWLPIALAGLAGLAAIALAAAYVAPGVARP